MLSLVALVAAGGMAVVAVWLVVEIGLLLEARVGDGESILQERGRRSQIQFAGSLRAALRPLPTRCTASCRHQGYYGAFRMIRWRGGRARVLPSR